MTPPHVNNCNFTFVEQKTVDVASCDIVRIKLSIQRNYSINLIYNFKARAQFWRELLRRRHLGPSIGKFQPKSPKTEQRTASTRRKFSFHQWEYRHSRARRQPWTCCGRPERQVDQKKKRSRARNIPVFSNCIQ